VGPRCLAVPLHVWRHALQGTSAVLPADQPTWLLAIACLPLLAGWHCLSHHAMLLHISPLEPSTPTAAAAAGAPHTCAPQACPPLVQGDSVLELYDAVVEQEVPYPAGGPISFELQDLFMRLLCKDPLHRITAAEVRLLPGDDTGFEGAGCWQHMLAQPQSVWLSFLVSLTVLALPLAPAPAPAASAGDATPMGERQRVAGGAARHLSLTRLTGGCVL
jgi:hypothetical protein